MVLIFKNSSSFYQWFIISSTNYIKEKGLSLKVPLTDGLWEKVLHQKKE
jgi:hypothetical protein